MASTLDTLSRRERQIMASIYRLGGGTVSEVRDDLSDPPSYSAVRTQLGILEGKGHLRHRREGKRYVYFATEPRAEASRRALRSVLRTFFAGSPAAAVAALLDLEDAELSDAELAEVAELVESARESKGAG
jgi:predicted transcriptional regulator